jgi:hypothetical protein
MGGKRIKGRVPSLEEALELAARYKSIGVRRKDDLVLFAHLWEDSEALADPRVRELRGTVYDEATREAISRPFHKFFNYREPGLGLGAEAFTRETLGALDSSVFLAEKVDGHLLQVFPDNRRRVIRFASRHSLENPRLWRLFRQLWTKKHTEAVVDLMRGAPKTLLFEVVHPGAPVLVFYERPRLVLLAARCVYTGQYLFPNTDFRWPLDAVKWKLEPNFDPETFHREALSGEGEGWVAYLPHLNDFVKFKTAWAFRRANFLKAPETDFMAALLENRLDDFRAALADRPDLSRALKRAETLLEGIPKRALQIVQVSEGAERSRIWQAVNEAAGAYPGALRSLFIYTAMGLYDPARVTPPSLDEGRAIFTQALKRYLGDVEKTLEAMRIFPRLTELKKT